MFGRRSWNPSYQSLTSSIEYRNGSFFKISQQVNFGIAPCSLAVVGRKKCHSIVTYSRLLLTWRCISPYMKLKILLGFFWKIYKKHNFLYNLCHKSLWSIFRWFSSSELNLDDVFCFVWYVTLYTFKERKKVHFLNIILQ